MLFLVGTSVSAQETHTLESAKLELKENISLYVYTKYGKDIKADRLLATIMCESGFKSIQSKVPSKTGPNGREDSWGIAQIHLPSHPTISRQQALDPAFSIRWMIEQWVQGNQEHWTCYRDLY